MLLTEGELHRYHTIEHHGSHGIRVVLKVYLSGAGAVGHAHDINLLISHGFANPVVVAHCDVRGVETKISVELIAADCGLFRHVLKIEFGV